MEGSLEIKNSSAGVEEPIKSEAPAQNSDSSERSEGAASPPPNCSICLGKLINTSFTDSCLHQFCFTCLLQWSKIRRSVPCASNVQINHTQCTIGGGLRSVSCASRVGVADLSAAGHSYTGCQLRRRRQLGHGSSSLCLQDNDDRQSPTRSAVKPGTSRQARTAAQYHVSGVAGGTPTWRSNPLEYRRNIYRHGIWATALPDVFGRFRECSAEFYRRQPQRTEPPYTVVEPGAQVLLLNNEPSHVAYLLNIIIDAL
ncbi:hypothetical protein DMN91_012585, partial [Ooceraea biroi]